MYHDDALPDLTTRWWGRFVDGIVLLPLTLLLLLVFHDSRLGILLDTFVVIVYEGSYVALWGRTVGKRVAGTRIISFHSRTSPLSPVQAFTRAAVFSVPALLVLLPRPNGAILSEVAFVALSISILGQRSRRGVTDLVAGTIVVDNRSALPEGPG